MTQKELKDTIIAYGWRSVYVAKKTKSKTIMSSVRREITESEILGLMLWYSRQKFEDSKCDNYSLTDKEGNVLLTVRKGE